MAADMAPGAASRSAAVSHKSSKEQRDFSASLRDIATLLPVPEPSSTRLLTKKETLLHMLRYLDFLKKHIQTQQSLLPTHSLPSTGCDNHDDLTSPPHSEPRTPPSCLKAKRKSVCGRPRKRPPHSTEPWVDMKDKRRRLFGVESEEDNIQPSVGAESLAEWGGSADWPPVSQSGRKQVCPVQDGDTSLSSSLDSELSLSQLSRSTDESPLGQEPRTPGEDSRCSACEERTGSEEGSPSSGVLDSPQPSSWACLLKDHMLGGYFSSDEDDLLGSPLDQTPMFPLHCLSPPCRGLRTLGFRDSLNLSPSLLTSPARDIPVSLLPEGHEELQALFEDVWVSPNPTASKPPSLPSGPIPDSLQECDGVAGSSWLSSQSEGEEGGDFTWTPTQRGPARGSRGRRRQRATKGHLPSLKKKCVNGFIMFCRLNRKTYLHSHPGTPSTVVTKELARLWHIMPKQERL
ncbi:meiosis initiator protein isoform X2 [Amia ocellicauda]|uniref:meiosis initiator protein isoform X2 n=1 Tax=Amia ocellicauda TaxID=2972642 RepID=UPI003463AA1E